MEHKDAKSENKGVAKKKTHWGSCKLLMLCCASLETGEYDLLRTQLFRIETKLAPTKWDFLCKKKSTSCYTSEGGEPQRWRKRDGALFVKPKGLLLLMYLCGGVVLHLRSRTLLAYQSTLSFCCTQKATSC